MSSLLRTSARCAALLSLAFVGACGGGGGATDAAQSPDAAVEGQDASADLDTGTGEVDAAQGSDAGAPACGSTAGASGSFPTLPAACMPRCSSATLTTVNACAGASCIDDALNFDGTAPATLTTSAGTQSLGCFDCYNYQQNHCREESCPTQMAARQACLVANPGDPTPCSDQTLALNDCVTAAMSSVVACANTAVRLCFP